MDHHELLKENGNLKKQRNIAFSVASVANFALAIALMLIVREQSETIIIPTTLNEYVIQKGRVSDAYLIDNTRDTSYLFVQRHPQDTLWFKDDLLRRVDPSAHSDIEARWAEDEASNRYKAGKRIWFPSDICVLPGKGLRTEAVGVISNHTVTKVDEYQQAIEFEWRLQGKRLWLVDIVFKPIEESQCRKMRVES